MRKNIVSDKLKNEFRKIWKSDDSMIDYCIKEVSGEVEFSNGKIFAFEKPRIETHFCFGYGIQGMDFDDAVKCEENARKSVGNFLHENLKDLEESLDILKNKDILILPNYADSDVIVSWYEDCPKTSYRRRDIDKAIRLSNEDKEKLVKLYESEIEKFKKRLNTYLKRFGLEKIKAWTYWVDE